MSRTSSDTSPRERLLDVTVAIAAEHGYPRASVAAITAAAGVSRRTFYRHFRDREDCFLAALATAQEGLLADVRAAVLGQPEHPLAAALAGSRSFAASHPLHGVLVMSESLRAGPAALEARDAAIAAVELIVEEADAALARDALAPDVSPRVVVGGFMRRLGARRRRGASGVSGRVGEITQWLASLERPLAEHRWRELRPQPVPPPGVTSPPLLAPAPLPAGRGGPSARDLAENRRLRILFAAAELAAAGGYRKATLARISRRAGLDARAFRRSFASKEQAFAAIHELYFQHLMSAVAGAFFAAAEWPERVWSAGEAFVHTFEQNPPLAHIGFLEAYAAGPAAEQRIDDFPAAFTVFLQDGYVFAEQASASPPVEPSRTGLEMIAASIFEAAYLQVRAGAPLHLAGLLPHVVHLCLAPFLGVEAADAFIDRRLAARPTRAA